VVTAADTGRTGNFAVDRCKKRIEIKEIASIFKHILFKMMGEMLQKIK
jgi:hypothetical protein